MALIYFAVSLFVSAFLLFQVQPMIGKMILPRLGGTPQVWNTCMMFFQTALLLGYAYTHSITSKLPVKKQLMVHCLVLLVPLLVLLGPVIMDPVNGRPFSVRGFGAEGGGNPIFQTLGLLTVIVGLPFLIVSTTAPLLQRWFNHTGHPAARDPYFLYGASNLGSILGLVLYPIFIERELGLDAQAWLWMWSYIILALLVAGCAAFVFKAPPTVQLSGVGNAPAAEPEPPPGEIPVPPPPQKSEAVTATPPAPSVPRTTSIRRGGKSRGGRGGRGPIAAPSVRGPAISIKKSVPEPVEEEHPAAITPMRRLRWIGLAAVPTSFMLGLTTYISTDISPIPLLWIIPLTLYLLSFVVVFSRWPVPWVGVGRNPRNFTPHKAMIIGQLMAIPLLMLVIMAGGGFYIPNMERIWVRWTVFFIVYYIPFFITALVCHGELARDRPPAHQLTEFYLWMSVGGALGGTFNALIAPSIPWFGLFEFPLVLVFAGLVRPQTNERSWTDLMFDNMPKEQSDGLKILLDVGLAVLLLLFSWWLISSASSVDGWHLRNLADPQREPGAAQYNASNFLYRVFSKTMGFSEVSAYSWANVFSLLITFGIPMGLALLTWKRPVRLALCLGAVLLANALYEWNADKGTLYHDRSFFGILRVMEDKRAVRSGMAGDDRVFPMRATYLMHGTTHHGLNFWIPDGSGDSPDLTRLPTTYYHRFGPVGVVMEKLNWFPGYKTDPKDIKDIKEVKDVNNYDKRVSYWADARLPASLVGSGVPGLGMNMPLAQLVSAWSEPAYACVGLGTGTMASYARPYQHMTFYEIDEHIRNFSLPPEGRETYFNYVQGLLRRGAKLEIIMGDARLTMKKGPTKEDENLNSTYFLPSYKDAADRKAKLTWDTFTSFPGRESYYRALELDAFSSDAIPIHLITKEAIELYMNKLTPNGVLLVHTSNRHVNLVEPVLKICEDAKWLDWDHRGEDGKPTWKTGLKWVICKDSGATDDRGYNVLEPAKSGHFGSEYVLVARKQEYLPPYALTPEEMKTYKELGIYANSFTYQQDELYRKEGLKVYPKVDRRIAGMVSYSSTIDFYTPESEKDPKVNPIQGNSRTVMENYGYFVPPGARTWTDDYSNVWAVFRW